MTSLTNAPMNDAAYIMQVKSLLINNSYKTKIYYAITGGKGAWRTNGCKLVQEAHNFTQMQCNHLTNFAILKVG